MKQFLSNILKLSALTIFILAAALFFVPDKIAQSSILGALIDKHAMLNNTSSPRIILLGGSNVSFGMNSSLLVERYNTPVVNMAVHAGIGLEYMINDIKPFIKKGDWVILIPEYENFYTNTFYGEMELVSVVFNVEPDSKKILNPEQWLQLLKYMPTYSAKKIKSYIPSLLHKNSGIVDIYHRNSFNQYGDAYIHWNLPNQPYFHAKKSRLEQINEEAVQFLKDFKTFVRAKHAELIIFPPVMDHTSYSEQEMIINQIEAKLKMNGLAFSAAPLTYRYDDALFFNSYYHLNKTGADKRTMQLIKDLDSLKSE